MSTGGRTKFINYIRGSRSGLQDDSTVSCFTVTPVVGWVMGAVDIYFRRAAVTVAFSNLNEDTFPMIRRHVTGHIQKRLRGRPNSKGLGGTWHPGLHES